MNNPQIDKYGTKRWFNESGQLHRDGDKPAVVWADGDKFWYRNGKRHRDGNKPALERPNGDKFWYQNGKPHRDGNKPALEWADGDKMWYQHGKRYRDGNKPAVEWANGNKYWYQNGKRIDTYYVNFGCFEPKTRKEALQRLNAKERPYSRELYLADINRMFPEKPKNPFQRMFNVFNHFR